MTNNSKLGLLVKGSEDSTVYSILSRFFGFWTQLLSHKIYLTKKMI